MNNYFWIIKPTINNDIYFLNRQPGNLDTTEWLLWRQADHKEEKEEADHKEEEEEEADHKEEEEEADHKEEEEEEIKTQNYIIIILMR